ncbi:unnamed protein product [Closterium sp. Naga37s-1]|nr:unnamed protein product [Closterium sp. Naga37s-1]
MSHSCVLIPPAACDDSTAALAAPLLPTASRAGGKECSGAEPASAAAGGGGGGHGEKRGLKRSLNVVDGVWRHARGLSLLPTPHSYHTSPPSPSPSSSSLSFPFMLQHGAGRGGGQRHIRHARPFAAPGNMVLGVVVGSGIFATPGVVLLDSGGTPISALICGSAPASLPTPAASSIPHAGGDGEYIQLAFGDLLSFVFMWMFFFVSTGGGIAILIVTFARYTIALLPGMHGASEEHRELNLPGMQGASEEQMEMGVRIIGCSFTLLLTAINCAGTRCSHQLYHPLPLSRAGEPLSSPSLNHRLLLHSPPHGHQMRWYVLNCPAAPTTGACSHPPDHPLLYHSSIPCPNHRLLLHSPPHCHQLRWSEGRRVGAEHSHSHQGAPHSSSGGLCAHLHLPPRHGCSRYRLLSLLRSFQLTFESTLILTILLPHAGVKAGALVQNILTVTKAILIAAVVACALFISLHGTAESKQARWCRISSVTKALPIAAVVACAPIFISLHLPLFDPPHIHHCRSEGWGVGAKHSHSHQGTPNSSGCSMPAHLHLSPPLSPPCTQPQPNLTGVKAGALVQNILTVTKALLIAAVVACAPIFISLHGTSAAATNFFPPPLLISHHPPLISHVLLPCAGVKAGALVQNILTVTKALLIAAVVACAPIFISLHGTSVAATNFSQPLPPLSGYNWSRAGAGLVAAVWAFDGW